jgi:hypothetical protein
MHFLFRPFTWLVLAEIVVVAGLGAAAWHVATSHVNAPAAHGLGRLPSALAAVGVLAPATPAPRVAIATPVPKRAGPTPGLALSPSFLGGELHRINDDESSWEHSEWTIIQAGLGFARVYVDQFVLPGVRAAEAAGR